MALHDLTLAIPAQLEQRDWPNEPSVCRSTVRTNQWHVAGGRSQYHARVHFFKFWSMAGTYIDFPGHIVETDDGRDASVVRAEELFRVKGTILHLNREDGSGPVTAADLAAVCPIEQLCGKALVINALGGKRFDGIRARSVYLSSDAVAWMVAAQITLLVSDVYESGDQPQNVFPDLFAAGISTVCFPEALAGVKGPCVRVTALPYRLAEATQLPCRLILEDD
ncbi:MAG: cyclase family protein [Lentisphaeria bacterium]|nr:cyclase family protein [Lentisphaeria bacterium]